MESLCAYQWNESTRHKPRHNDPLGALFSPYEVLCLTVTNR